MYRKIIKREKNKYFHNKLWFIFEKAIDNLIGKHEFILMISSAGNITRRLSMKNHKKFIMFGNFDNFNREIPIINLFKVHGSVSWSMNIMQNKNWNKCRLSR